MEPTNLTPEEYKRLQALTKKARIGLSGAEEDERIRLVIKDLDLKIPVKEIKYKEYKDPDSKKETPKETPEVNFGDYLLADKKGRVSSTFGMRRHPITKEKKLHRGLDLAAKTGTNIITPLPGKVLTTRNSKTAGKMTIIDHGAGLTTTYMHQNDFKVKKGQSLKKGDIIGTVGSTGRSTGPHLHFEVRQDGKIMDPDNVFNFTHYPRAKKPNKVAPMDELPPFQPEEKKMAEPKKAQQLDALDLWNESTSKKSKKDKVGGTTYVAPTEAGQTAYKSAGQRATDIITAPFRYVDYTLQPVGKALKDLMGLTKQKNPEGTRVIISPPNTPFEHNIGKATFTPPDQYTSFEMVKTEGGKKETLKGRKFVNQLKKIREGNPEFMSNVTITTEDTNTFLHDTNDPRNLVLLKENENEFTTVPRRKTRRALRTLRNKDPKFAPIPPKEVKSKAKTKSQERAKPVVVGPEKVDAQTLEIRRKAEIEEAKLDALRLKEKQKIQQRFQNLKDDEEGGFFSTPAGKAAMPGLALMGLDFALEGVKYSMRKKNRERIKELEAKEAKGRLGRDEALEQQEFSQMVNPVRAIAEQSQRETEATLAGMGESTNPARINQLRRAKQQAITQAIGQAAEAQSQRVSRRAAAERGELEARRATEYGANVAALDRFARGAGVVASQVGAVRAAEAQTKKGMGVLDLAKDIKKQFPKQSEDAALDMAITIQKVQAQQNMADAITELQKGNLAKHGAAGQYYDTMLRNYTTSIYKNERS